MIFIISVTQRTKTGKTKERKNAYAGNPQNESLRRHMYSHRHEHSLLLGATQITNCLTTRDIFNCCMELLNVQFDVSIVCYRYIDYFAFLTG